MNSVHTLTLSWCKRFHTNIQLRVNKNHLGQGRENKMNSEKSTMESSRKILKMELNSKEEHHLIPIWNKENNCHEIALLDSEEFQTQNYSIMRNFT